MTKMWKLATTGIVAMTLFASSAIGADLLRTRDRLQTKSCPAPAISTPTTDRDRTRDQDGVRDQDRVRDQSCETPECEGWDWLWLWLFGA